MPYDSISSAEMNVGVRCGVVSHRVGYFHFVLCRSESCNVAWGQVVLCGGNVRYKAVSCRVLWCRVASCPLVSCCVVSGQAVSYHVLPCHAMLHRVVWCYVLNSV